MLGFIVALPTGQEGTLQGVGAVTGYKGRQAMAVCAVLTATSAAEHLWALTVTQCCCQLGAP